MEGKTIEERAEPRPGETWIDKWHLFYHPIQIVERNGDRVLLRYASGDVGWMPVDVVRAIYRLAVNGES